MIERFSKVVIGPSASPCVVGMHYVRDCGVGLNELEQRLEILLLWSARSPGGWTLTSHLSFTSSNSRMYLLN